MPNDDRTSRPDRDRHDRDRDDHDELLTPAQVARVFGVDPKTVTRWANQGKLQPIRTLGGHRRYRASEVRRLRDEAG